MTSAPMSRCSSTSSGPSRARHRDHSTEASTTGASSRRAMASASSARARRSAWGASRVADVGEAGQRQRPVAAVGRGQAVEGLARAGARAVGVGRRRRRAAARRSRARPGRTGRCGRARRASSAASRWRRSRAVNSPAPVVGLGQLQPQLARRARARASWPSSAPQGRPCVSWTVDGPAQQADGAPRTRSRAGPGRRRAAGPADGRRAVDASAAQQVVVGDLGGGTRRAALGPVGQRGRRCGGGGRRRRSARGRPAAPAARPRGRRRALAGVAESRTSPARMRVVELAAQRRPARVERGAASTSSVELLADDDGRGQRVARRRGPRRRSRQRTTSWSRLGQPVAGGPQGARRVGGYRGARRISCTNSGLPAVSPPASRQPRAVAVAVVDRAPEAAEPTRSATASRRRGPAIGQSVRSMLDASSNRARPCAGSASPARRSPSRRVTTISTRVRPAGASSRCASSSSDEPSAHCRSSSTSSTGRRRATRRQPGRDGLEQAHGARRRGRRRAAARTPPTRAATSGSRRASSSPQASRSARSSGRGAGGGVGAERLADGLVGGEAVLVPAAVEDGAALGVEPAAPARRPPWSCRCRARRPARPPGARRPGRRPRRPPGAASGPSRPTTGRAAARRAQPRLDAPASCGRRRSGRSS